MDIGGTVSGNTITVTVSHFTEYAVMAATKVQPAPTATSFSDVASSYWACAAINSLSAKGIVSGYPDGKFRPDSDSTRAEFASIINRVLNLQAYNPSAPDFGDVSPGDWCYGPVESAAYVGIVKGYGSEFKPNEPISREQMADILVKLGEQDQAKASASIKTNFADDAAISSWARGGVVVAVKDGLLKGYPDGSFRPQGAATRAEARAMIMNFLKFDLSVK